MAMCVWACLNGVMVCFHIFGNSGLLMTQGREQDKLTRFRLMAKNTPEILAFRATEVAPYNSLLLLKRDRSWKLIA